VRRSVNAPRARSSGYGSGWTDRSTPSTDPPLDALGEDVGDMATGILHGASGVDMAV
jgi:hypothetical protein